MLSDFLSVIDHYAMILVSIPVFAAILAPLIVGLFSFIFGYAFCEKEYTSPQGIEKKINKEFAKGNYERVINLFDDLEMEEVKENIRKEMISRDPLLAGHV